MNFSSHSNHHFPALLRWSSWKFGRANTQPDIFLCRINDPFFVFSFQKYRFFKRFLFINAVKKIHNELKEVNCHRLNFPRLGKRKALMEGFINGKSFLFSLILWSASFILLQFVSDNFKMKEIIITEVFFEAKIQTSGSSWLE